MRNAPVPRPVSTPNVKSRAPCTARVRLTRCVSTRTTPRTVPVWRDSRAMGSSDVYQSGTTSQSANTTKTARQTSYVTASIGSVSTHAKKTLVGSMPSVYRRTMA
ncbi:uncharacterized protein LOC113473013 [Diaphorina citri]|uniref:Uncharacterized protein LOC113473013 n=1 Tax=Diaphorina citri TaxID=121845 RepID=A0A3Q0JJM6_DIACI|nr:uncharacterized protein LOC113473013 [Diaphorina citri]